MQHRFFDIAFTPAVQAAQSCFGSRAAYAAVTGAADVAPVSDALSDREIAFISTSDSFYLATVSQTGWPDVQHRGGPAGFVRHLEGGTLGWPEFRGNRQYITVGNTRTDDRVALLFMDYPHRQRLKLLGHIQVHEAASRPDLAVRLGVDGYRPTVERFVIVTVEAFDWNCPQHITPRFTTAQIEIVLAPLQARIAQLEAQLKKARPAFI